MRRFLLAALSTILLTACSLPGLDANEEADRQYEIRRQIGQRYIDSVDRKRTDQQAEENRKKYPHYDPKRCEITGNSGRSEEGGRTEFPIPVMRVGDVCYTVSWAMMKDTRHRYWLDPNYPVSAEAHGTVDIQVTRTEQGYEVCNVSLEEYEPDQLPGDKPWLEVLEVNEHC